MMVLDTETLGLDPRKTPPTHYGTYDGWIFKMGPIEEFRAEGYGYIGHNLKFDSNMIWWKLGLHINQSMDTMLLSQLYDSRQKHTLDNLGQLYIGEGKYGDKKILAAIKKGEFWKLDKVDQEAYLRRDCEVTYKLYSFFLEKLDKKLWDLYNNLDNPVSRALTEIERYGFTIDMGLLQSYKEQLELTLEEQNKLLFEEFGGINIDSPIQLKNFIKDSLGVEIRSTDENTLNKLAKYYPKLNVILDYRETKKYANTYIKNIYDNAYQGKVYPQFHLAGDYHSSKGRGTQTGRTSSSNPNLQNQPRTSSGPIPIRKLFVASPGTTLVAFDYNQLELKTGAFLAKEPNLLVGDRHGEAGEILDISRQDGKTCNFAMLYGATENKIFQASGGSKHVKKYYRWFKETFPKAFKWAEKARIQVEEERKVTTYSGRVRYIDDPNQGPNTIIQGSAADIAKEALVNVHSKGYRILGIIHDELITELPNDLVETGIREIPRLMSGDLVMNAPVHEYSNLQVSVKSGQNWGEMQ